MECTCPKCRHVVDLGTTRSGRCTNCGAKVSAPEIADADAAQESSASERPGDPPLDATVGPVVGETTVTARPASIASFVLAILFFIPIVPQILAIGFALVALLRRRKPDERVTLAWIGLVLSALALIAWALAAPALLRGAGSIRLARPSNIAAVSSVQSEWEATSALMETMERVHRASTTYRRDFRSWPPDIDTLVGQWLPRGFRLPPELTYRPVPESQAASATWILVVSEEISVDDDGKALGSPHRLLVRLGGNVELLPTTEVSQLLAAQESQVP